MSRDKVHTFVEGGKNLTKYLGFIFILFTRHQIRLRQINRDILSYLLGFLKIVETLNFVNDDKKYLTQFP